MVNIYIRVISNWLQIQYCWDHECKPGVHIDPPFFTQAKKKERNVALK